MELIASLFIKLFIAPLSATIQLVKQKSHHYWRLFLSLKFIHCILISDQMNSEQLGHFA